MMKKLLYLIILILITTSVVALSRTYTQEYNNALTRSITDSFYCLLGGTCNLQFLIVQDILITGNLSFIGAIENVTIINQNITGQLSVSGNLQAENITANNICIDNICIGSWDEINITDNMGDQVARGNITNISNMVGQNQTFGYFDSLGNIGVVLI